jgi:hypothetical protein
MGATLCSVGRRQQGGEPAHAFGKIANLHLDTTREAEEIVDEGLPSFGDDTRLAFSFLRHCGLDL